MGRFGQARDPVVVEVPLLDRALLEGDLRVQRQTQTEYRSAFHLIDDGVTIHVRTRVHGHPDTRDSQGAGRIDPDLDNGSDIGQEAALHGEPQTRTRRQLAAPAGAVRGPLQNVAQAARCEGILGKVRAVICERRARRRKVDDAIRADSLEHKRSVIASRERRHLRQEGLLCKHVIDIGYRTHPAGAQLRGHTARLGPQMGNVKRRVTKPQIGLELRPLGPRGEGGADRGEGRTVAQRLQAALAIHGALQTLGAHRVVEAVADIVFPAPLHAHRPAAFPGQPGRLRGEIRFGLAAKGAAEQRDVDLDLVLGQAEQGRDHPLIRLRILRAGPHLHHPIGKAGRRGGRLHRGLRQVGNVILRAVALVRRGQRRIDVTSADVHIARLAALCRQHIAESARVVSVIGRSGPLDFKPGAALLRGPGVFRQHRDTAERLEEHGIFRIGGHRDNVDDSRHLLRLPGIE